MLATMPVAHNVLRTGADGGLVIAADFPATGRTVASFADLFRGPDAPLPTATVWETAPPPVGGEVGMTGLDHVDRWLADVGDPTRVCAVVAFCVGAVYAAVLAERLGLAGGVPLLLFDPERPDPDLLLRHYTGVIEGLAAVCAADERAAAMDAGWRARQEQPDIARLAVTLGELFAEHGGPALRRTGLDERRREELFGTFSAFIAYLVAAAELDPLPAWRTATVVSSSTPHSGLNPLRPEQRAALVSRELRFDAPHTSLLRDPRVARACRDLLVGQ
jgi:hypothetical protein